MSMMAIRDRTVEFCSTITSFQNIARPSCATSAARPPTQGSIPKSYAANSIQLYDISATLTDRMMDVSEQVHQLSALSKTTSNFRDERVKIHQLATDIKSNMEDLKRNLTTLERCTRQNFPSTSEKSAHKQWKDFFSHHDMMFQILRERYMDLVKFFDDTMYKSTQMLQKQKERREKLGINSQADTLRKVPRNRLKNIRNSSASSSPTNARNGASSDRLMQKRKNQSPSVGIVAVNIGQGGSQALRRRPNQERETMFLQQRQLFSQPQHWYQNQRAANVMSIERSLTELLKLFEQVSTLLVDQRTTMRHIGRNVDAAAHNTHEGVEQLKKYLALIEKNRWLLIQVFAVIIFFAVFFVLFVA